MPNQPAPVQPVQYVALDLGLLNEIHTYLMQRPMAEVERLVVALRSCSTFPVGLAPETIMALHNAMMRTKPTPPQDSPAPKPEEPSVEGVAE